MSFFFDNAIFIMAVISIVLNLVIKWRERQASQEADDYSDVPYEWDDLLSEEGEQKRTIRDSLQPPTTSLEVSEDVWSPPVQVQEAPPQTPIRRRMVLKQEGAPIAEAPKKRTNLASKAREGLVWGIILGPCKSKERMMERRML